MGRSLVRPKMRVHQNKRERLPRQTRKKEEDRQECLFCSCPLLPRGQVVLLLGGELVELVAHAVKLKASDFLVEILGHDVDLRLQLLIILQQVFGGKSLIGKAHIHNGGRVSFGGSQIDKATFAEQIN